MSVLSASGTLVSREDRRHSRSTLLSSHAFSRHSTAHTLITAQTELDSELFKPVFRELNGYQERFETLSDQVLGAMSVFDESSLGLNPILPVSPSDECFIPVERRRPTTTATGDLEEGRRFTAQSIADLVFAVWNRLQLPSDDVSYDAASTPSSVAMESHTHTLASPIMMPPLHSQVQWTPKAIKQRIKLATQLKSAIVTFWSAQSHFQEKAQLILDIYQDPSEIENDDRLRALRSRHLHNLLACNLDPGNGERLAIKYREDQDKMAEITEQLQDVWLGLVMLLEKPVQTASSKAEVAQLGDGIGSHESFGHKLIRLGKNKRQAFKPQGARPTELRYTNTHLDTIFALSTHPGKAGIAVIRVSGPQAKTVLRKMTPATSPMPKARYAVTRRLVCPQTSEILDRGMVIWFPGPKSFTGEDSVEFHCHGGRAVVDGVLRGIGNVGAQVRLAEAGEFARRAFENDKLDLTEVEGLADLLNAETEAQRRLALRQAEGGLKNLYDSWRTQLIKSMALIEALIDFGEDENIEDDVYDNGKLSVSKHFSAVRRRQGERDIDSALLASTVVVKVQSLHSEIKRHMDDDRCGEILRDGIHVTILGPPNAGKSSFLNFVTKRQAAIVSPIPGTTRDVVEVSLDIGGYPVLIGDTAGLRSSQDEIEMEGVRRAQDRINLADINIAILPVTDFLPSSRATTPSVDPLVLDAIKKNSKTMVLINKMDLTGPSTEKILESIRSQLRQESEASQDTDRNEDSHEHRIWAISCQTGEGISRFLEDFISILKKRFESSLTGSTSITQYRHREHLENCLQSLEAFLDLGVDDVVLGAEELRHAASDLGRITGRVDVEDVLDVVFREFCIGK
ncbi:tRNA modification GTPase gtpbp3, mitochondrial [Dissophora globulifera]|nr:tRNA modification GTPase gtpbp3, mitochondrial [Dissophora globulifera]